MDKEKVKTITIGGAKVSFTVDGIRGNLRFCAVYWDEGCPMNIIRGSHYFNVIEEWISDQESKGLLDVAEDMRYLKNEDIPERIFSLERSANFQSGELAGLKDKLEDLELYIVTQGRLIDTISEDRESIIEMVENLRGDHISLEKKLAEHNGSAPSHSGYRNKTWERLRNIESDISRLDSSLFKVLCTD